MERDSEVTRNMPCGVGFRRLFVWGICLWASVTMACVAEDWIDPADENSVEDPSFRYSSLNDLNYSILREFVKKSKSEGANITYPVCVAAEFSASYQQRAALLEIEEQAINRWNKALIGQPQWPVQQIDLYLVGGNTRNSCPSSNNGVPVYKLIGINGNRGYAEFWNYINAVEKNSFLKPNLKREMHEYGHQLGLGDTYTEAGYQQPINQPPGIMNLYYNVSDLTEDDIASIRNVWRMIRTNSNDPCGPGYTDGQTNENRNGHLFCVKLNGGGGSGEGACTDSNQNCNYWAGNGECTKNPGYMLTNCCRSCKSAGGGSSSSCTDSNQNCNSWARNGECTKNPGYMLTNCCRSCK